MLTPLMVTLVAFHELMYVPRLLDCQQNVPAPSKTKGEAITAVTGEQVLLLGVAERVGVGVSATVP